MPSVARERVPTAGRAWDADRKTLQELALPRDPRSWDRADVAAWVAARGGLPERFPMNGKALCLMSEDMFARRVPTHGVKLYQDFRRRLAEALALQELLEKLTPKNENNTRQK